MVQGKRSGLCHGLANLSSKRERKSWARVTGSSWAGRVGSEVLCESLSAILKPEPYIENCIDILTACQFDGTYLCVQRVVS